MKLIHENIFTYVTGDPMEVEILDQFLTVTGKNQVVKLLFQDEDGFGYRFYSGLFSKVTEYLRQSRINLLIDEEKISPVSLRNDPGEISKDILPNVILWDHQRSAIRKALYHRRGVVHLPTGGGKTNVMAGISHYLYSQHKLTTLIVCYGTSSVERTIDGFNAAGVKCGRFSSELTELESIMVGNIESLFSILKSGDSVFKEIFSKIDCLIFNECQHSSARSSIHVSLACYQAEYRIALSATPYRDREMEDPRDLIITGLTGPLIFTLSSKFLRNKGFIAHPHIFMPIVGQPYTLTRFQRNHRLSQNWHKVNEAFVIEHESLHQDTVEAVTKLLNHGKKILVIVSRIEHGKRLLQLFKNVGLETVFYSGSGGTHTDEIEHEERLFKGALHKYGFFIGSRILEEDIDLPEIDAIVIPASVRSSISVVQRIGRGVRGNQDQSRRDTIIVDFDNRSHVFLTAQANARKREYGYEQFCMHDQESDSLDRYLDTGTC